MASEKREASNEAARAPVATGRRHYRREFTTRYQRQQGRGRSYSNGTYDPRTDMRTNRVHIHDDHVTVSGGSHHRKPDARGWLVDRGDYVWGPEYR